MELTAALDAADMVLRPRFDRRFLLGSHCPACRTTSWPSRAVCHRCGTPSPHSVELSTDGTLISYTTVWIPRLEVTSVPYTLGLVHLPEGVRIFAHVRRLPSESRVPLPVKIVFPGEEGGTPPFWFEPQG